MVPFAWCQGLSQYSPSKIIPPAPTAASLGAYGNLSVGYYSGTPDINIPLYEIKTPSHSLPVRLQYSATGVRLNENAGWVGLGWSLVAGGVITRTVRGIDDLTYNGYHTAGALPPHNNNYEHVPNEDNWVKEKLYFDNIKEGSLDGEPDIFNFNFDAYSGKFSMGKRTDGSPVFMSERNNLKIEYLPDTRNWKITNGNGYLYYFGAKEWVSEDYTYSSDAGPIEADAPLNKFYFTPGVSVVTAWYLDSIVSPTSEAIRFFYSRRGESFGLVNTSEKALNLLGIYGQCQNHTPNFQSAYHYYIASKPTQLEAYLDSIVYRNGSVKFLASDREDVEYPDWNTQKPGKLSSIIIRDHAGERLKKYVFGYSYFDQNATKSGRLKLEAITEYGATDEEEKPPFTLAYFNLGLLPSKYAVNSIDHWGFYNGKNNKTLLPPQSSAQGQGVHSFPGADRSMHAEVSLKSGVLASITYPTGGSTHFDYEPHDYTNMKGDDRFRMVLTGKHVYSAPDYIYPYSHETEYFELKDTATAVSIDWNYEKVDQEGPDLMNVETIYGHVRNIDTGEWEADFSSAGRCPDNSGSNCTVTSGSAEKTLKMGRYMIYVRPVQGYIIRANANWLEKDTLSQRQGGGIRIKSIVNRSQGKPEQVRKFYYTEDEKPDGRSSGKLISPLQYFYHLKLSRSQWSCNYDPVFLVRMSSSIFPPGLSSKGTVVGYSKVAEVFGENGEGGRNVYYFHNGEDYVMGNSFPSLPTYSHPLGGKMAVMATFDSAGTLLRKVDYAYQVKEEKTLKGVKIYSESTFSPQSSLADYLIRYYDCVSAWSVLASEEESLYSPENMRMTTIKKYYYDNPSHKELTREQVARSDGSTLIRKFKYPGDYAPAGSGSFVAQMKLQHVISPVIEQQSLLKKDGLTKLLSASFTEYKLFHGKFFKPAVVYQLAANKPLADTTEASSFADQWKRHGAYQPEVYLDHYDAAGNLVQYHKAGEDTYQTYLWGYQGTVPVVEVKNASPAQVFYTSFEEGQEGIIADRSNPARTGRKYLNKGDYTIPFIPPSDGRAYKLSYWYYLAGKWHFSGELPFQPTIGAGTWLDEIRVYPAHAPMTTYTYHPSGGLSSMTDPNHLTTFYDYDDLSRLKGVKDDKGNILKKYEYHYADH
ncbi:MAG: hypothetical protein ACO1O1_04710 [Adhaeribacter sp.]